MKVWNELYFEVEHLTLQETITWVVDKSRLVRSFLNS